MMRLVIASALVAFVAVDAASFYNDGRYQPSQYNNPYSQFNKYNQYNKYNKYNQYQQQYTTQRPVTPVYYSSPERAAAVLRSDFDINPDGSYQYAYDTENGISAQQQGQQKFVGSQSGNSAQGSFHFRTPEGVPVDVTYTADENGYHPISDILPTPPPIPLAILRSIEWNAAHARSQ